MNALPATGFCLLLRRFISTILARGKNLTPHAYIQFITATCPTNGGHLRMEQLSRGGDQTGRGGREVCPFLHAGCEIKSMHSSVRV